MTHTPRIILNRELRAAAILSIPTCIFLLIFLALLLEYGGHRYAHLSVNPFCKIPPSHTPAAKPPITVLLHISDLHVNDIDDGSAKRNLRLFQNDILPRWAPLASAVLVSGDLVNAVASRRYPFGGRSAQLATEWGWLKEYAAQVNKSVPWLAVHGNHDTFGTSVQHNPHVDTCAAANEPVLVTRLRGNRVFALDCTLEKPLHRPLNFFGDGRRAAAALNEALSEVNSTVVGGTALGFGHFPTAVMAGGRDVHHAAARRDEEGGLVRPKLAAFLSGHLHTLKGFMPGGLQAVSRAGVLELQLPDMVQTGAYRVITLDAGSLAFKDFTIDGKAEGVDEVIVTNVPRAGLCSAGAGWGALMSSHVRLVGPERVMERSKLEARVDGVPLGVVKRLSSNCEKRTGEQSEMGAPEVCVIAYGVPWNASLYDDGQPHLLTIHSGSQRHASHPFSFNGVPETGMKARVIRLLSALFSLSDFEAMSPRLCSLGFLFTFAFCVPGLLRKRAATFVLFIMAALLRFGPAFIVTYQLREADAGLGMAGLRSVWLPSSFHPSGVDLSYMLSVTVLFGSLVPVSFLDAVMSSRQATILQRSIVARVWVPFYLLKSLSWCLEVVGAHGILAALISPSCVPLFIACSVSVMMSFNALAKKED